MDLSGYCRISKTEYFEEQRVKDDPIFDPVTCLQVNGRAILRHALARTLVQTFQGKSRHKQINMFILTAPFSRGASQENPDTHLETRDFFMTHKYRNSAGTAAHRGGIIMPQKGDKPSVCSGNLFSELRNQCKATEPVTPCGRNVFNNVRKILVSIFFNNNFFIIDFP